MLTASTNTLRTKLNLQRSISIAQRSMTVLSKQSAEEYKQQNYSARMERTGRPVSPHVTIYSFPVTALSSITIRITGVALSGIFAGLGTAELVSSGAALDIMQYIGSTSVVAYPAKFAVAFPLVYHYLGGMRHLVWDHFPDKLNNVDVPKASIGLFGASLVLGTGACFL
eukprot:CAMPEP_0196801148 /NCGR_PEP_ID=MMETSP1362-20130617/841_1 /TAXON_ID=163516 /ORGANISM="Leptocylindrus danicus, Strain CCMP1856" /LENGTH=168 /DNA_ID=CAMNT_0042171925 /DNA_START=36 /DNA_END=542 /DNA_ORIENTATION=+